MVRSTFYSSWIKFLLFWIYQNLYQTYSMDCYFRQTWVDKRLEYSSSKAETLALSISMLEKIWKPDTYFHNGKQSYLHTITTPNKFVRLKQDGRVLYSSRLTVKASCPMNLEDFPMDTQRCPLKLGSWVSFVKLTGTISWPPLEDGRVSTKEFLEASKVILRFFDTLGKVYTPVKHDVEGNITKLSAKYSKDPERFAYIQDMIEHEVCNGENFAANSLLWLKRGLHFIYLFLHALVLDHEKNVRHESLMENMRVSYELSLKPYHNWVLQKLFVILSHAAPTRQELYRSMTRTSYSPERLESHEEIIGQVKLFAEGLQTNLKAIFDLYIKLRLDHLEFTALPSSSN